MQKHRYTETAAKLFCLSIALFFIWFLFEYTLGILLPFLFGFAIGVPIHLLSKKICRRTKFPPKICAVILLTVFLVLLAYALIKGVERILFEAESLLLSLGDEDSGFGDWLSSLTLTLENLSQKIPFIKQIEKIEGLEGVGAAINEKISESLKSFLSSLTSAIPAFSLKVVKSAPKILIGLIVAALSCFYFATDYSDLKQSALNSLSPNTRERFSRISSVCSASLKKYIRAYLLIMLITFVEVLIGLIILKKSYATLIALGVAFVDLLPIFGAGTVLIPWAIVCFIIKDVSTATGLLILYAVITIVRQVIEPKIIGTSLGIHPLLTLFAMVAALELFGVAGMVLSPFILIILKESLNSEAL